MSRERRKFGGGRSQRRDVRRRRAVRHATRRELVPHRHRRRPERQRALQRFQTVGVALRKRACKGVRCEMLSEV